MIIPEAPRVSGVRGNSHAQSWGKGIIVAIATLLLAAGFGFAGASTATAAPAFANSHVEEPPCRGEKPGVCPNSSARQQSNGQGSVHQSNDGSTTQESNDQPASTRSNEESAGNQSPSS